MVTWISLGLICLLAFLPVQFRIYCSKSGAAWQIFWELSFLKGLLKRRQEVRELAFTKWGLDWVNRQKSRLFSFRKKDKQLKKKSYCDDYSDLKQLYEKNKELGLGMTLASYILSVNFPHWLIIAESLEKHGWFHRLIWQITLGTKDSAGTASLVGLMWLVESSVAAFLNSQYRFKQPPQLEVVPDFNGVKFDMLFDCIFRVRLGYIIIAAIINKLLGVGWRKEVSVIE